MSGPRKETGAKKKVVATNRRARHDYEILETVEAGLVLRGSEVKGLRSGRASIAEAYGRIEAGEVWLLGMHVPEYADASYNNHAPERRRKLLLSRQQIRKWEKKVTLRGQTLIPLQVYFDERGWAKVELALGAGKKAHDRRQDIKKREMTREMERYRR